MKLNRKNKILLLGLLFSIYICYAFAIANTIDYYNKYKNQQQLLAGDFNNPEMLRKLVQKEKQLTAALGQYANPEEGTFQNRLLKELSYQSKINGLKIIDFQEPHIISNKEVKTTSYIFSLEGSFNGILLLLNSIENDPSLGSVKHIDFIKKRNYKTNQDYLTAQVILQKTDSE
jgi:hypothetical protein